MVRGGAAWAGGVNSGCHTAAWSQPLAARAHGKGLRGRTRQHTRTQNTQTLKADGTHGHFVGIKCSTGGNDKHCGDKQKLFTLQKVSIVHSS